MLEGMIPREEHREFTLRDGKSAFFRYWEGRKAGDAIVYLHGLESHSGWFAELARLLNRDGFSVYGLDRRGSGMDGGERGHMEGFGVLVEDAREVLGLARREHAAARVYLMGLCWGAKIAALLAGSRDGLIDGLILVTPAIKSKADLTLREKFDMFFDNTFCPRRLFDVPLDENLFTRDARPLDFIKNDPLKLRKATARFFFETGKMSLRLDRIAPKIKMPVLLLLAGEDGIIDNEGVKEWFGRLGSTDKAVKIYDGSWHGLTFERPKEVSSDISGWVRGLKK